MVHSASLRNQFFYNYTLIQDSDNLEIWNMNQVPADNSYIDLDPLSMKIFKTSLNY